MSFEKEPEKEPVKSHDNVDGTSSEGSEINALGHRQELQRNFGLLSICGLAVTTGNTWVAQGGSLTVAFSNGGPPGVIYEFIVVSICYWLVALCIAELASAMPSAAGVYHWASITAGKHGRVCGWFAGYWNVLAWIFGAASMSAILGNQLVSMYAIVHPALETKAWHVFITYIIVTWICCSIVLFSNRSLPGISKLGMFLILGGVLVTIIVCAVMPHVNGTGYASNRFVWRDWENNTGYSSNGFVFLAGMLNGAYSVGTPDVTSHLAEEMPRPSVNIPKAMLAQMTIGFITGLLYMIPIFYSIHDIEAILSSTINFPLAEIYHQATNSRGGAVGLLVVAFLPTFITCVGCYITAGRMLWTLGRDNATPLSSWVGHISPRFNNPFNATIICGIMVSILGCIYVGSKTAFNAFVGSYVQLSTLSYLAAILPHLITRRKNVRPGYFWMKSVIAEIVLTFSSLYIMAFVVIFCFPFFLPTDAQTMNYASVMTGGLTIFIALWLVMRKNYVGPQYVPGRD
ncbi:choline transporter [Zopfia rhizophila CBS 207.26]|uniref:Choline transporter n=1 Tax=Zopfia rhizophila CBS 207.26 TaxID=1314779 RepID=A0A6A6ENF2_9PEZI|nr:choline transporter [Zopfia rhizophila CBS 207.26]